MIFHSYVSLPEGIIRDSSIDIMHELVDMIYAVKISTIDQVIYKTLYDIEVRATKYIHVACNLRQMYSCMYTWGYRREELSDKVLFWRFVSALFLSKVHVYCGSVQATFECKCHLWIGSV